MNGLVDFEGNAYVTDEKNRGSQEIRHHIAREFIQEFQDPSRTHDSLLHQLSRAERKKSSPELPVSTGMSRINCTGLWLSHFVKTPVKSIVVMPLRTSRECVISR